MTILSSSNYMIDLITSIYIVVVVWNDVKNWKKYLSIQFLRKKFHANRIDCMLSFRFYVPEEQHLIY